jgi:hypothetical protein
MGPHAEDDTTRGVHEREEEGEATKESTGEVKKSRVFIIWGLGWSRLTFVGLEAASACASPRERERE